MTRLMVLVLTLTRMGLSTKEVGKMTNNMELGLKGGLMELYMKDRTMKEKRMVKVS